MATETRGELSEATSVLLDGIRFTAAVAVLVGHLTQPAFSTVWPNLTAISIAAVGAFFVMSGLVIEYTHTRHRDVADYARARLVRLWSVVIPALLYTALADAVSLLANPSYYAEWWHPLTSNAIFFLADALFLNESWAQELSFGSDNPIWSLGYEGGYYALFGAVVYLRGGWRIGVVALLVALKGPQLLILLPVWLLGVATCRLLLRRNGSATRFGAAAIAAALAVLLLVFGRNNNTAGLQHMMESLPGGPGHSLFVFAMLACGLATSAIILFAEETRRVWGPPLLLLKRPIRWLAQSTFSIYLFHLPTLIVIQAVTHYERSAAVPVIATGVTTFAVCIALSLVTERRKGVWDPAVRALLCIPRLRLASAAAADVGTPGLATPPRS